MKRAAKDDEDKEQREKDKEPTRERVLPPSTVMCFKTLQRKRLSEEAAAGACRKIADFVKLNRLGEGTYGVVYRAQDNITKEVVAVKRVKMVSKGGLPLSSLREISTLIRLRHENLVQLRCVAVGRELESVYLVMEYCEHDLGCLLDNTPVPFTEAAVKCMMLQLIRGVEYLHANFVIHRDLKLSNILLNDKGVLKICDFGMCREYGLPPGDYSPRVVTLWYRAPEVLMGADSYSIPLDCWALGCIFGELLNHKPLMPGDNEISQMGLIVRLLGEPNELIWPDIVNTSHFKTMRWKQQPYNTLREKFPFLSENGLDLLNKFLTYDPAKRIQAQDAWRHPYFSEPPLPCTPECMPTFPHHRNKTR